MDFVEIGLKNTSIDWQVAFVVVSCFTIVSITCFLYYEYQRSTEKSTIVLQTYVTADDEEQISLDKENKIDLQLCSICHDELLEPVRPTRNTDLVKTKCCEYFFHRKCIRKWIRQQPSCPLCRAPFKLLR